MYHSRLKNGYDNLASTHPVNKFLSPSLFIRFGFFILQRGIERRRIILQSRLGLPGGRRLSSQTAGGLQGKTRGPCKTGATTQATEDRTSTLRERFPLPEEGKYTLQELPPEAEEGKYKLQEKFPDAGEDETTLKGLLPCHQVAPTKWRAPFWLLKSLNSLCRIFF